MKAVPDIYHVTLGAYGNLLRMSRTMRSRPTQCFWHEQSALWHLGSDNPHIDVNPPEPGMISMVPMLIAVALHHSDPRWLPGWEPDKSFDPPTRAAAREIIVTADADSPDQVIEWRGFHCAGTDLCRFNLIDMEIDEWFDERRWRDAIEATEFPDPSDPDGTLSGRVTSMSVRELPESITSRPPGAGPARVPLAEIDCVTRRVRLWVSPWAFLMSADAAPGGERRHMLFEYTSYPSAEGMRQDGPMASVCGMLMRKQYPGWDFDAPEESAPPQE